MFYAIRRQTDRHYYWTARIVKFGEIKYTLNWNRRYFLNYYVIIIVMLFLALCDVKKRIFLPKKKKNQGKYVKIKKFYV